MDGIKIICNVHYSYHPGGKLQAWPAHAMWQVQQEWDFGDSACCLRCHHPCCICRPTWSTCRHCEVLSWEHPDESVMVQML